MTSPNPAKPELLDHYDRLHHAPHGTVILWERLAADNRWHKIEPHHPVAELISRYQGQQDVYVTVNEFRHWRLIRNLKSLRACYVDIDGFDNWFLVLEALDAARLPDPTFIVLSGRGIHCYWLLEPLPAQTLPVWQRIQDTLTQALTPLGADYRAKDCTRLLRLVGTINSHNGQLVRGYWLNNNVWTLHELADEVLGYRNAQKPATVVDFKAQTARRRKKTSGANKGSIYTWWHLVYTDLCTIADYHWLGGVPEGKRDTFLFLMANALSWFASPETLETEIIETAKTFTNSLTEREIQTYTQPILQRAQAAYAGKKHVWNGKEVDPRYAFKAETIREWLGEALIPPELWPELRTLVPKEIIQQRKREHWKNREKTRKARNRVEEGRYQRNIRQHLEQRNEAANQRRTKIWQLREEGFSWKEIAHQLGMTEGAARNLGYRTKD
jgi:hypothetical protein